MGWQDDSTPVVGSGWQSQSTPLDAGPATPNLASPAPSPPSGLPLFAIHGPDKAGEFLHTAADSATFGLGDTIGGKVASLFGGPNADALRAQTQAARDDIGIPASMAADVAGYGLGPGKFGSGAKVADLLGGLWKARAAGSAVEGAGAAALGTAGHGDTSAGGMGTAALLGGGLGAITGGLPGARAAPKGVPTSAMENDATAAWRGPEAMPANPSAVGDALVQYHLGLSPGDRVLMKGDLKGSIQDAMRESSGTNSLTAGDVTKFQRAIGNSARSPDDKRIAAGFKDALEKTYDPATMQAVEAARAATNKAKISGSIDEWLSDPASAPDKIAAALKKNPQYYQSRPGLYEQMQAITQMGQPSMAKDLAVDVGKRTVKGAIGGMVGGPYLGTAMATIGAPARAAIDAAPVRRALLAAQHLNNTGDVVPQSASAPQHPRLKAIADFLRSSGYAAGASGAF